METSRSATCQNPGAVKTRSSSKSAFAGCVGRTFTFYATHFQTIRQSSWATNLRAQSSKLAPTSKAFPQAIEALVWAPPRSPVGNADIAFLGISFSVPGEEAWATASTEHSRVTW